MKKNDASQNDVFIESMRKDKPRVVAGSRDRRRGGNFIPFLLMQKLLDQEAEPSAKRRRKDGTCIEQVDWFQYTRTRKQPDAKPWKEHFRFSMS